MRLALVALLAAACGSSSSNSPDGGGGDDSGVDPTGDGGMAGPHTVKLTLNNRPMNAGMYSFFVAYQDGSAKWQEAPAPTGDTYSFTINAPSYGVAYGCIGSVGGSTTTQLRAVNTAFFAIGERTELTLDVPARCSDRYTMGVQLSGTVTNRPTSGFLVVQFGGRYAYVGSQSGNFTLQAQPGTHDLIIVHAIPEGNGEYYVDEAVVERDVTVTAATQKTIDFSNASRSTQFFNVDVLAPTNARVIAQTTLYTQNGTTTGLVRESANWESDSLAQDQMRATDIYDQQITVTTLGESATVSHATDAPTDQTFTAPPPLGSPNATVATKMPYPILETTWPAYASTVGYVWNAQQQLTAQQCGGNLSCTVVWSAYLSPGVTGSVPGFRMPLLDGLSAWKSAFELAAGAGVVGGVTAQTSSAGAGDFPPGVPANGTDRAFVRSDFSVTP